MGYAFLFVTLSLILSAGLYRYSRDRVEGEVMTGMSLDTNERNDRLKTAQAALEENPKVEGEVI